MSELTETERALLSAIGLLEHHGFPWRKTLAMALYKPLIDSLLEKQKNQYRRPPSTSGA